MKRMIESGLTFQEWTQDVDTSRTPVTMIINSSELRTAGFKLKEVIPPSLEKKKFMVFGSPAFG